MEKERIVNYMRKDFQECKKNVNRSYNITRKSHDKKPTLNKTICNKKKKQFFIKCKCKERNLKLQNKTWCYISLLKEL
jgi:hypothetical protein